MRTALYEAVQVLLPRTQEWSGLKAWAGHAGRSSSRRQEGDHRPGSAPRCHPAPDVAAISADLGAKQEPRETVTSVDLVETAT
jgi:hypothetical protein